jgi:hypothetical protein
MLLRHKDDREAIATDEMVSVIRAPVIDDDYLMDACGLAKDAINRLLEKLCTVVRWDYDAYARD